MLKRWRLPSDDAGPEDMAASDNSSDAVAIQDPPRPPGEMRSANEVIVGGGVEALVRQLLGRRGLHSESEIDRFLNPKLLDLDDPTALPGCEQAASLIVQAIRDDRPIIIYGDYDVDGVTASAILWHTLRALHAKVETYIPHRIDEGYGLHADALQAFADASDTDKKPLIVTVDCGITAAKQAQLATELGLELIITDHHTIDRTALPQVAALVHPELNAAQPGSPLCGAGVALKLAWQTARVFHGCTGKAKLPRKLAELMLDLLPLAALGTVADVVPLIGENRVLTVFGLSRIKRTPFIGLQALINSAGLGADTIDAYHVGFVLGPRLNACGRMGHAREALKLLTDPSPAQAKDLADFLHQDNETRRSTEREIFEQARVMIERDRHATDDRRAIVLADADWHPGVVGIVASRLVEKYHRPVVMLAIDQAIGEAKGSARSVDAVDLHGCIHACREHLLKFGGHQMAAGLTLQADRINAFREALVQQVNAELAVEQLAGLVEVDAEVDLNDCDEQLFYRLKKLAPFGRCNPRPRLLARNLTLSRPAQRMGKTGKHLSLALRNDMKAMRGVAFGLGELANELPAGANVDVVFEPNLNTWRGVTHAELQVVDICLRG